MKLFIWYFIQVNGNGWKWMCMWTQVNPNKFDWIQDNVCECKRTKEMKANARESKLKHVNAR